MTQAALPYLCTGAPFTEYFKCSTRKTSECAKDGLCKIYHGLTEADYQEMHNFSHGNANLYICVLSAAPTTSLAEYRAWWVPT